MNTELSAVESRAAKHAALGDPTRLRIVDVLSLGDRSPGELRAALDVPSNLLAHHLNVLAGAGLLVRTRSEADRRRSYVRLAPGAMDALAPAGLVTAPRVVFVCTANSARSQLAAALWHTASSVPATSAGTHPAEEVDPGAVRAARRHRLTLHPATPRRLADIAHDDDIVITVCDRAHEELGDTDALHWSVPDPVRVGTDRAFDAAFDDLSHRIGDLAPRFASASSA